MQTHFIEVTQESEGNWGKFMVGRFTPEEWRLQSALPGAEGSALIGGRGWTPRHLLVLDLQTGEGAVFAPGGSASADLGKHQIWVCPMFEPFLHWLYQQQLADLRGLPRFVKLANEDAPFAMQGYRRSGQASHEQR